MSWMSRQQLQKWTLASVIRSTPEKMAIQINMLLDCGFWCPTPILQDVSEIGVFDRTVETFSYRKTHAKYWHEKWEYFLGN